MVSNTTEIEAKLAADHVTFEAFEAFIEKTFEVEDKIEVLGPDDYYTNGKQVLRHRKDRSDGSHELTIKQRKSETSTRDRLEIDLKFKTKATSEAEVAEFIDALGYTKVFTVIKNAIIYDIQATSRLAISLVIYDCWIVGKKAKSLKRFIEIEASKGSDVTHETAKRHVREWCNELRYKFELGEPLNQSLWEIYSGKPYPMVGE